jgi:hypothetical protein
VEFYGQVLIHLPKDFTAKPLPLYKFTLHGACTYYLESIDRVGLNAITLLVCNISTLGPVVFVQTGTLTDYYEKRHDTFNALN